MSTKDLKLTFLELQAKIKADETKLANIKFDQDTKAEISWQFPTTDYIDLFS